MEEEALARNDSAAAAIEVAAQRQAEIEELRPERASLQSDPKAAVVPANSLSAFEELKASDASFETLALDLQGSISSLQAARAEASDRFETKRRMLEALAKRVTDLEGDFLQLQLQNDLLVAMTLSDRNEAVAEVILLKEYLEKWQMELKARHSEAKKVDDALKLSVNRLAGEKNALKEKNGEAEANIAELRGKVVSLEREVERVLEEKNETCTM